MTPRGFNQLQVVPSVLGCVVTDATVHSSFTPIAPQPLEMSYATRTVAALSRSAMKHSAFRQISSGSTDKTREFKVLLDNQTLYIGHELAEAMGWSEKTGAEGVKLSLHGLSPTFFTVTPTGSDNEQLARNTVQSGLSPNVQGVLEYLKDR